MLKYKNQLLAVLLSALLVSLSGCADTITFTQAIATDPVGFWHGLWHGMTLPFSFFGALIWDDIAIYAIYNNGGWYDFGFWLGGFWLGLGGLGSVAFSR